MGKNNYVSVQSTCHVPVHSPIFIILCTVQSCTEQLGRTLSLCFLSFSCANKVILYLYSFNVEFSSTLVHAGHLVSYTFSNANAICCSSCQRVSDISAFLEIPSKPCLQQFWWGIWFKAISTTRGWENTRFHHLSWWHSEKSLRHWLEDIQASDLWHEVCTSW